jgi:hypothetical protein
VELEKPAEERLIVSLSISQHATPDHFEMPPTDLSPEETTRRNLKERLIRNVVRATFIDLAKWAAAAALLKGCAEETPDSPILFGGIAASPLYNLYARCREAKRQLKKYDEKNDDLGQKFDFLSIIPASVFHATFGVLMHELGHKYAFELLYESSNPKISIDLDFSGKTVANTGQLSEIGASIGKDRSLLLTFAAGPIAHAASTVLQAAAASLMPNEEHRRSLILSAAIGYLCLIEYCFLGSDSGDFARMDDLGFPHTASVLVLTVPPILGRYLSDTGLKNSSVNGGDSPLRIGAASSLPQSTDSSAYSALKGRDCASICPFKPVPDYPRAGGLARGRAVKWRSSWRTSGCWPLVRAG